MERYQYIDMYVCLEYAMSSNLDKPGSQRMYSKVYLILPITLLLIETKHVSSDGHFPVCLLNV